MKPNNRPDPDNRSKRPRRSAIGGAGRAGRLTVTGNLDPNFNYRTVNDDGNRIEEMKSYGYELVQDDSLCYSGCSKQAGSTHSVVVDKREGKKGVLMRQPNEYHEEDKKLRAKAIAKTEESMFRNLKTEDGRYGEVEGTTSLAREVDT